MTALEYMKKQLLKNKSNYIRESNRGASEKILNDIQNKISYYEQAVEALDFVGRIKMIK